MVKQQVTDWVNSRPRTEDGDVFLFAESSVETYIDGARFPEDMLASREEVGRAAKGDLAVKTTLRRPLQAGEPWLFTDTFRPHAMCDEAFHATSGQCVSHQMLSLAMKQGQPIWSPEELDVDFAEAYQTLYAGKATNPYAFENESGQLEEISWQEHGRTVEMLEYVCRKRSVPLHTVWHNCLVLVFRPPIYDKHVRPRALCGKGMHAYFYAEANTL